MSLYAKLDAPLAAPELVLPATLGVSQARPLVERAVKEGVLRPSDIGQAKVGDPSFFYAPFWRVSLSVEGFHLGVGVASVGRRSHLVPTGGARRAAASVLLSARAVVPYTPRIARTLGRLSASPALEVEPSELAPTSQLAERLATAECVDADVSKEQAERVAAGMLVAQVQPHQAVYSKYEPVLSGTLFAYYPLFLARYRYEGEARDHAGEEFFVLLSARTGKIVAAKHPSTLRAVTAKLRRFLSFDEW